MKRNTKILVIIVALAACYYFFVVKGASSMDTSGNKNVTGPNGAGSVPTGPVTFTGRA